MTTVAAFDALCQGDIGRVPDSKCAHLTVAPADELAGGARDGLRWTLWQGDRPRPRPTSICSRPVPAHRHWRRRRCLPIRHRCGRGGMLTPIAADISECPQRHGPFAPVRHDRSNKHHWPGGAAGWKLSR